MSRYTTTRQIKDKKGRRKAETTIISVPPVSTNDIFIEITTPERLDVLANEFYGSSSKRWIIAAANGLGKGTLFTPENIRIRIPIAEEIQSFIESENEQR